MSKVGVIEVTITLTDAIEIIKEVKYVNLQIKKLGVFQK